MSHFNTNQGCSVLGYSEDSPDLVICAGSPDIPHQSYMHPPDIRHSSIEVSLENGINGSEMDYSPKTPATKNSFISLQTSVLEEIPGATHFELPEPPSTESVSPNHLLAVENSVIGGDFIENELSSREQSDIRLDGDSDRLQLFYENQKTELSEAYRALDEMEKKHELKNKECQEAWRSLKELQNELMRKSMHVGSLAFAIEGQVKEKGKWFSSMRDLARKLKILKMDHIKLSEETLAYKKCVEDMTSVNSIIQSKFNKHIELHEDLKMKVVDGAKERKELHNKILELKGNIRVFCRCRPLNFEEIGEGTSMAIDFESAKDGELTVKLNGNSKKTFKFDAVFSPKVDQADVFEETSSIVASVLDGYNVCIFAYGQTGTGKTYTMEGTEGARGVNYRTLEELFNIIETRKNIYSYKVSVSVFEVYNEQIRDLLIESQPGAPTKRLDIKQSGLGMHHVPGLVEANVTHVNEVWEVLRSGSSGRAVGSTNANEHSSRSHCLHCVMINGENLLNGESTRSKLWLVDLAGSERLAKSEVQGERLRETQNINKSLSALGDVISALSTKSAHIPFRNSKLTHLLQDSLGGDSKTLMFVQISPNENDLSETICSLNFASRVRGIELGPAKKQVENTELVKYKQMVERIKQETKTKDFHLKKMEETIHGLDIKITEKDMINRNLQEKIKELESQLLIERNLARRQVGSNMAEQQQRQISQQDELNSTTVRPPVSTRANITLKTSNENKELTRILTESNFKLPIVPPSGDALMKHVPKHTARRGSICATSDNTGRPLATRRISMAPAKWPLAFQPLTTIQANEMEEKENQGEKFLAEPTHIDSPKKLKVGTKTLGNILRRSLQKKIYSRSSPNQQNTKRVGINVGMEKVRISIGSRGKTAHRVLGSTIRRAARDSIIQKQSHREKEIGWNTGTSVRKCI
ncbi:microtubule binding motor protein [Lithospermum erythrorhizon]|uniref:Kinesin-like protein n=1 Tax=Lithospermum erythrorhizon TaxID=34254 RepID=A0AAV3QSY2_LITER